MEEGRVLPVCAHHSCVCVCGCVSYLEVRSPLHWNNSNCSNGWCDFVRIFRPKSGVSCGTIFHMCTKVTVLAANRAHSWSPVIYIYIYIDHLSYDQMDETETKALRASSSFNINLLLIGYCSFTVLVVNRAHHITHQ